MLLRAEFIAGAEEDSRRRLGRGLTEEELHRSSVGTPGTVQTLSLRRTRDQRLQLFDRYVADLLTESAAQGSWQVTWEVTGVTTKEPGRESIRSWLLAVRGLDAPKDDTYLPTIMDDLDAMSASEITRQRVAVLRQRYEEAGVSRLGRIQRSRSNVSIRNIGPFSGSGSSMP